MTEPTRGPSALEQGPLDLEPIKAWIRMVKGATDRAGNLIYRPSYAVDALEQSIAEVERLRSLLAGQQTTSLCPLCLGRGHVPAGFYGSTAGQPWTVGSNVAPEQCRSCNGSGFVSLAGQTTPAPTDPFTAKDSECDKWAAELLRHLREVKRDDGYWQTGIACALRVAYDRGKRAAQAHGSQDAPTQEKPDK